MAFDKTVLSFYYDGSRCCLIKPVPDVGKLLTTIFQAEIFSWAAEQKYKKKSYRQQEHTNGYKIIMLNSPLNVLWNDFSSRTSHTHLLDFTAQSQSALKSLLWNPRKHRKKNFARFHFYRLKYWMSEKLLNLNFKIFIWL